jgi:ubiquinone/menaquinone biosynthesis C-methylase UbiE
MAATYRPGFLAGNGCGGLRGDLVSFRHLVGNPAPLGGISKRDPEPCQSTFIKEYGDMGVTVSKPLSPKSVGLEGVVADRYARAARAVEPALCCPVLYDPALLAVIPDEVIERDYGCGDPSSYVREGETVLDLGSGSGKICFIASQLAGPAGRVIGIDMNDAMLDLATRASTQVAEALGYANVEFRKGRIQDLKTDLARVDAYLNDRPIQSADDLTAFEDFRRGLGEEEPVVSDDSIDIVLSNCVLNLVQSEEKAQLFQELYRVVRPGGRIAISDIVSDEEVPDHLRRDPELWSGCISGALREDEFLRSLERVGFYGIEIAERGDRPWRTVEGIEFRSLTATAHKGKEGPCLDRQQAVIYRGPWMRVIDDDGHVLDRGKRMAVCDKTFKIFQRPPYAGSIVAVHPLVEVPLEEALPFDCSPRSIRDPADTKGEGYDLTTGAGENGCGPADCC